MRFQTKLLFTYSLISIGVIFIISIVYFNYSRQVFEKNAVANLELMTQKISQQLETVVKPMDFTLTHLIANESVMSSMASLAYLDPSNNTNLTFINQGLREIRKTLYRDPIHKNFHRVNIFNDNGFFFSSNYLLDNETKPVEEVLPTLSWLEEARKLRGRVYLIPPYMDSWTSKDIPVFGIARAVSGERGLMGYIEVQIPASELEKVFTTPEAENLHVFAVLGRGDVFYQNEKVTTADMGLIINPKVILQKGMTESVVQTGDEIIIHVYSKSLDMHFYLIQQTSDLLKPLASTIKFVVMVGALVLTMSILFAFLSTRQLTKPLRKLKSNVAKVELGNLTQVQFKNSSNNEIQALNESFQDLLERLSEAIEHEMKAQTLQVQASMDALQAQINPHFMYNILNVIANKGLKNGDEEIGEICSGIADMLRYSTSTKERESSISGELGHVRTYLSLMQTRHLHKLNYEIECDTTIENVKLPKIVLQPLVENAIHHGFEAGRKVMEIKVSAVRTSEKWHVYITDNGGGFTNEKLNEIKIQMAELRSAIQQHKEHLPFEIGGMGLLQTYLRLYLFYKGAVEFDIYNNETEGATIHIAAILDDQNLEDSHV